VFSVASWQFLAGLEKSGAARALGFIKSPLASAAFDAPDKDRRELVVISSPFFPNQLATGYSNPAGSVVYSINGNRVRSLNHLVEILRDLKDDFVSIEFDQRTSESLVFPRKQTADATDEILTDNGVRSQGSPDALAVWQAQTAK